MKKLSTVLIGFIFLIVLLVLSKNLLAKALVENGVRLATGLSLKIEKFDFSLTKGTIKIENLELLNPRGFPDRTMIKMPKIGVGLDWPGLFKGKVRLRELSLFLQEFTVVKNQKGEVNLNALKAVSGNGKSREKGKKPEKKNGKAPEFGIELLNLRVDRVVFKDYSKGVSPSVKEFNINLRESYSKVPNLYFVTSLIVVKTLTRTTISNLTQIDLTNLQGTISDRLALSKKFASETTALAETQLKEAAGLAGVLTKKIKFPFGKDEG